METEDEIYISMARFQCWYHGFGLTHNRNDTWSVADEAGAYLKTCESFDDCILWIDNYMANFIDLENGGGKDVHV